MNELDWEPSEGCFKLSGHKSLSCLYVLIRMLTWGACALYYAGISKTKKSLRSKDCFWGQRVIHRSAIHRTAQSPEENCKEKQPTNPPSSRHHHTNNDHDAVYLLNSMLEDKQGEKVVFSSFPKWLQRSWETLKQTPGLSLKPPTPQPKYGSDSVFMLIEEWSTLPLKLFKKMLQEETSGAIDRIDKSLTN